MPASAHGVLDDQLRSTATRFIDRPAGPRALALDPDNVKKGFGKLVLMVIELLRELLERQAIRRMESGALAAEQVERLGLTFMHLAEQVDQLKRDFGLVDEDLNLDLGPLGTLF